jgi:hypothetical protein
MSESKSVEPMPQSAGTPTTSTSWRERFLPRTPQEIAITACALALVAAFFAPWVISTYATYSGYTLYRLDKSFKILWLLPILALATVERRRNNALCRKLGTATAVITWIYLGYVVSKMHSLSFAEVRWGQPLSRWLAFALFAFSGQLQSTTLLDLVAKKLSSRKAEVYGHSATFPPDFHFSAKDFYAKLEDAIRAKEWPGVQLVRLDYSEAGLLSHKRQYLRVIRQRHLFDICAATFGKDYFFSVREAEIPAVVSVRAFIVLLLTLYFVTSASIQTLGLIPGSISLMFLLVFILWFLFNILKLGLTRIDSILIQLPVVGPVYETWFRKDTYFQQDTRMAFLHSVTELVKEHVEETTSANGVKFLDYFENQPLMDGLYKRSRVDFGGTSPAPATK